MKILAYLQKHNEELVATAVGGGGLSVLFTDIELILKILVASATLVYFIIKISKELKK